MEDINNFRTAIHKTQYPATLWHYFAFRGHITLPPDGSAKEKDKNGKYSTIRGFAKTTMKTVTKATGIKPKHKKSHKYMLPNMQPMHGRLSVAELGGEKFREEDELSDIMESSPAPITPVRRSHNTLDSRGLERLSDRRDCRDFVRLGLGSLDMVNAKMVSQPSELTRISVVNHKYNVSRSLPALMVVPGRITDESLKRLAKVHKQGRLPSITWRHPSSRALLVRGSSYHQRGVMSIIRGSHANNTGQASDIPTSIEAEQYLAKIIDASPQATLKSGKNDKNDNNSNEGQH